jgi:lysophospholipase L1-like esterase
MDLSARLMSGVGATRSTMERVAVVKRTRDDNAGAIDLSLMLGSIFVFLLFCEFVVFRFVWLASDAPWLDFVNDVVRYAPNQQGVWRIGDEIAAPYRINGQGWNSGTGDYAIARNPGIARVALIGDSFVEAMQVASTASLAATLAPALSRSGRPTEVYRFAISGAPLSQYVHMLDREAVRYRPDWVVVVVVHNDFDESFQFKPGRYTSSFMKFRVEDAKVVGELPPTPWRPDSIELLRQTATWRFMRYRWRVQPDAIADWLLTSKAGAAVPEYANVHVASVLANRLEIMAVADHAVVRLATLVSEIGARLLIVMDGDRDTIYQGSPSPLLELNQIMVGAADRHDVNFLDLHPIFTAHWTAHHQRLHFDSDFHWNELGHSVAGAAIAARIQELYEFTP